MNRMKHLSVGLGIACLAGGLALTADAWELPGTGDRALAITNPEFDGNITGWTTTGSNVGYDTPNAPGSVGGSLYMGNKGAYQTLAAVAEADTRYDLGGWIYNYGGPAPTFYLYTADSGETPSTATLIASRSMADRLPGVGSWAGYVHLAVQPGEIPPAELGKNILIAFTGATWSYVDQVRLTKTPNSLTVTNAEFDGNITGWTTTGIKVGYDTTNAPDSVGGSLYMGSNQGAYQTLAHTLVEGRRYDLSAYIYNYSNAAPVFALYAADPGEDPTTAEAIATLATKPWLGALSQWSAGSVHLTTTNITAAQAGKNLLIAFTGATWSYLDHVQVRYEPAPRARQVVRVATFTNQIQDTYVIDITGATYSNLNFGAREDFSVGTAVGLRKGLLRFDLTSLPAGYDSIKRITLKLTEHPTYDSTGSGLINAYRIAAANKEWVEGTGSGAAQDGSACWAYKAYSATSPTNWAGSPGLSTPGTDYDTETVGTFDFDTTSNRVYEVELAPYTPALRDALVAEWRGPQANNAGIVLIGPTVKGNELEIASSENSTTAARPVLTVEYYYTPKGTLIKIW